MQRNMRHTGRVMVGEIGTNMVGDPSKKRDTDRVASRDRERERTAHRERHTENVNTRRHARTHTHTQK